MKNFLKEFKQLSLWSMLLLISFVTNSCDENNNSTTVSVDKTSTYFEKSDLNELINKIGERDIKLIELIKNNPVSMLKTVSYQKTKISSSEYYFDTDNIMSLKNNNNQAVYIIPVYKSSSLIDNNIYSISVNINNDFIDTKLNILQLNNDGTQEYITRDFEPSKKTSKTSKTATDFACYCTIYYTPEHYSQATGWLIPEETVMYCSSCTGINISGGISSSGFGTSIGTSTGANTVISTILSGGSGSRDYGYAYSLTGSQIYVGLYKKYIPDYSFSSLQKLNITNNPEISGPLLDFLNTDGNTLSNKNFVVSIIDGIEEGTVTDYQEVSVLLNAYKQAKIILALKTQLNATPSLLLNIPCSEIPKWQALISLQIPTSVKNKITTLDNQSMLTNYKIQYLEHASGAAINLDYFPVTINTLPTNPATGLQFTPTQFLNYVRLNINSFVDTNISSFSPTTLDTGYNESQIWNSTNPLGVLIHIDINSITNSPSPGDGSVICSQSDSNHWIFTTVEVPYGLYQGKDGEHPVSGNREFGLIQNPNGTYTFYTRGVDRITDGLESLFVENASIFIDPFENPDLLWNSLKTKVANFVQNNSGSAVTPTPSQNVIWRPDWYKVRQVLRGQIPISDLGCK